MRAVLKDCVATQKGGSKNSDIDSFGVSTNPIHIQRTACKHQSPDEMAAAMRLLEENRCRGISQAAYLG